REFTTVSSGTELFRTSSFKGATRTAPDGEVQGTRYGPRLIRFDSIEEPSACRDRTVSTPEGSSSSLLMSRPPIWMDSIPFSSRCCDRNRAIKGIIANHRESFCSSRVFCPMEGSEVVDVAIGPRAVQSEKQRKRKQSDFICHGSISLSPHNV